MDYSPRSWHWGVDFQLPKHLYTCRMDSNPSLWNSLPQVDLPFRTLCLAATAGQIPMHWILRREGYVVQDTAVVRETVCSLGYCIPQTHERKEWKETPHGYHHTGGDVVSGTCFYLTWLGFITATSLFFNLLGVDFTHWVVFIFRSFQVFALNWIIMTVAKPTHV